MQRVLDRIDAPAIVTTPTHDMLAWNPACRRADGRLRPHDRPSGHGSFGPAAIERASSVEVLVPAIDSYKHPMKEKRGATLGQETKGA
jgi:hypothetical protein